MNRLLNIWNKWFPKSKPLNALDAYTITKYGLKLSKDALHKRCIEEITSLMRIKSARNEYSLAFDLDENIPELGIYLSEYYTNLGFTCFVLDNSIDKRIEIPQLYLSWKQKGVKLPAFK